MLQSKILLIHRDVLKAGCDAVFKDVEQDAARMCAEFKCPHPHLAIESLSGPKEVWWLNAFESEAEQQRVTDAYASNGPLSAALQEIRNRREGLLETEVETFAHYKEEASRGAPWRLAGARFLVVTVTTRAHAAAGAVFEGSDGVRFVFRPAGTQHEANAAAAAADPDARVFAVRPYWGMPAQEWIDADPAFWRSNPVMTFK